MIITLHRIRQSDTGTFGALLDGGTHLAFTCEKPWRGNLPNVSCIPPGSYVFTKYGSPTKGPVWITQDVPDRSNIEIHAANWPSQLEGCVAVGDRFLRDVGNRIVGVADSRLTMDRLLDRLPDAFTLTVEACP